MLTDSLAAFHITDAAINLTCGLMCLAVWFYRRVDFCFALWGGGLIAYSVIAAGLSLLPNTPVWNAVGYSALGCGVLTFWAGYRSFDGKAALTPGMLLFPFAPLLACLLFGGVTGNWEASENWGLTAYCILAFGQANYAFRHRSGLYCPRAISAYAVFVMAFVILASAWLVGIWITVPTRDGVITLSDHIVTIVFTFSVLAMVGERDFRALTRMARHDPLTEALNRSGLADAVARGAIARTLLLVDLDHFKTVNDRFGHPCGDKVLREFAERTRRAIGSKALLVRLGGEEFLIVAPQECPAEAERLAQAVCLAAKDRPMRIDQDAVSITVSIGIAIRNGAEDLDRAIGRADAALYKAKADGRDRAVACSADMLRMAA